MPTIEIVQSGAGGGPAWWAPLLPTLATSLVAIAAVWLTARFAATRNHNDRIWDRRVAAYSTIFEALHQMSALLETWEREYFRDIEASAEEEKRRGEEYRAAKARLLAALAREQWMLEDDVAEIIGAMSKALDARKESFFESIDEDGGAILRATKALRAHARAELMRPRLLAASAGPAPRHAKKTPVRKTPPAAKG